MSFFSIIKLRFKENPERGEARGLNKKKEEGQNQLQLSQPYRTAVENNKTLVLALFGSLFFNVIILFLFIFFPREIPRTEYVAFGTERESNIKMLPISSILSSQLYSKVYISHILRQFISLRFQRTKDTKIDTENLRRAYFMAGGELQISIARLADDKKNGPDVKIDFTRSINFISDNPSAESSDTHFITFDTIDLYDRNTRDGYNTVIRGYTATVVYSLFSPDLSAKDAIAYNGLGLSIKRLEVSLNYTRVCNETNECRPYK